VWLNFYWKFLIVLAQPLWGTDMAKAHGALMAWYVIFMRGGMLLSPFVYFALCILVIECTKALASDAFALRTLALEFVTSLVPIAFVYNVSHYYRCCCSKARAFPPFLTAPSASAGICSASNRRSRRTSKWEWSGTQVALILAGRMVSVSGPCGRALRIFPSRRQASMRSNRCSCS
jgi:hypothetical protein